MKKPLLYLLLVIVTQINAQCWKYISGGTYHTLAIKTDGSIWCWGANSGGVLGLGVSINQAPTPTQIGSDSDWKMVSAGNHHSLALKTNGTLWAWGSSDVGQIGNGTSVTFGGVQTPIQIGSGNNWKFIYAGYRHSIGIKTDGTLWTWGWGSLGQIGDGSNGNVLIPKQVGTDTDWQSAYGGRECTIAIKTNGTLWGCGSNTNGELGVGNSGNKLQMTQIGTSNNWQSISGGYNHSLGLKTDGTLWTWGKNNFGQLGNGTSTGSVNVPTQMGTGTNWKSIEGGGDISLATKTDGTLWAWGYNLYGQLGDGNHGVVVISNLPKKIGIDTDWQFISEGMNHTMAIKTDGTLWGCGQNSLFQLGNNSNVDSDTLIKVSCVPTEIKENSSFSILFSIHPNPSSNILNIKNLVNKSIESFVIMDLFGRVLLEQKENATQVNIQELPNGVYQLIITSGDKRYTTKFIKSYSNN